MPDSGVRLQQVRLGGCPHCMKGSLIIDEEDNIPCCLMCGWRPTRDLTKEEEKEFSVRARRPTHSGISF